MKHIFKKFIVFTAMLVLLSLPLLSQAATLDQLNQQKNTAAQQAADAKKKAADKQKEANYLSNQINSIESQIAETQRAINNTTAQIADTQAKIEELKNQIKIQEENLARENEKMNQIIIAWYMEGDDNSVTTAILSSNTLSELVTKQEYYDSIKQQIEATIEKINQLKAELDKQKAEQDAKMAELKKLQETQELQKIGLQSQQWVKNRLFNDATNMISELKAQEKQALAAERQAEQAIAAALSSVSDSGTRVNQGDIIGNVGMTGFTTGPHIHFMVLTQKNLSNNVNPLNYLGSSLAWPLNSYTISQVYGCTEFARCGDPSGPYGGGPHNGIDLATGLGSPIHAAASGIIIIHQYYSGYGNVTIIHHDNGLYTVYGHMSS